MGLLEYMCKSMLISEKKFQIKQKKKRREKKRKGQKIK
jgi:hypothetical protein